MLQYVLVIIILLTGLVLFACLAVTTKTRVSADIRVWKLTKALIVDQGQTIVSKEGIRTTGMILEAQAHSSGKSVPDGKFQLTFSASSPAQENGGRQDGIWYIEGEWALVDRIQGIWAPGAARNHKQISGNIKAELPFNPAAGRRNWSANAWLRQSLIGKPLSDRPDGRLILDGELIGQLVLPASP